MNRLASVMAALLAGVAIGAMGINGLRAQNKAPAAYFIADISEISNPAAFSQGIQKVGAVIVASAGHYLARSDNIVSLTGMPPKRFVIVAFESMDAAKAWADKVKALMPDVDKYSKQRRFLVEGM